MKAHLASFSRPYFGTRPLNREKSEMAYHRTCHKFVMFVDFGGTFVVTLELTPTFFDGLPNFVNIALFVAAFNPRNNSLFFRSYPYPSPSFP